jgi:hypothetical protein
MASYQPVARPRSVSIGRSRVHEFAYANEGAPTNAQVVGRIGQGHIPNARPQNNAYWSRNAQVQRHQEMAYGLHVDPRPPRTAGPYTRNAKSGAFFNAVPGRTAKRTLNYNTGLKRFTRLAGAQEYMNNNNNTPAIWCDPKTWSCFRGRRTRKNKST